MILWNRGILENLTVAQLLAVSYGIRRFIFVFTRSLPTRTTGLHQTSLVDLVLITITSLVSEEVGVVASDLAVR
jgi:hypothetical protein